VQPISKFFGQVVREERIKRGISQEKLAQLAQLHRTYMSRIEAGQVRLGLDAAEKLANGLGVPLSEMVAKAEEYSKSSRR
jgi:transcriptional regulator with XRE-family HTH domain